MEPKKVTREEIQKWYDDWPSDTKSRRNPVNWIVDFASDHGLLKEPVLKYRWAWLIEGLESVPESGVTKHKMSQDEFENWNRNRMSSDDLKVLKVWKLPGTEVQE